MSDLMGSSGVPHRLPARKKGREIVIEIEREGEGERKRKL